MSYDRVISEVYIHFHREDVTLERWPALPFGIKATDKEGETCFFYLDSRTDKVKWLFSGREDEAGGPAKTN